MESTLKGRHFYIELHIQSKMLQNPILGYFPGQKNGRIDSQTRMLQLESSKVTQGHLYDLQDNLQEMHV